MERNFEEALTCIKIIDPKFVVVTGDLTDARRGNFKTSQNETEWKAYKRILKNFGAYKDDFWFDLRGNHDCFDTYGAGQNFFAEYSVQKTSHYSHIVDLPWGKYEVAAIDGCPFPGSSSPLNFFGSWHSTRQKFNFSEYKVRHSILLGHYPLSTLTFNFGDIFDFTRYSLYLCGHLHTLFCGLGRDMYALHGIECCHDVCSRNSLLELEVGDLKKHRILRIVAIDHDLISFVDFTLDDFESRPILILTNPKDARFLTLREPTDHIITSPHIRILVFGKKTVRSIAVFIDGKKIGQAIPSREEARLWELSWDPENFKSNDAKHYFRTIKVEAVYDFNQTIHHEQQFTFGANTYPITTFGGRFARVNLIQLISLVFQTLYYGTILLLLAPSILRNVLPGVFRRCRSKLHGLLQDKDANLLLDTFYYIVCCSIDPTADAFYPIVSTVYLTCLRFIPWIAGYIVPSSHAISYVNIGSIRFPNGTVSQNFDSFVFLGWAFSLIFVTSIPVIFLTSPKYAIMLKICRASAFSYARRIIMILISIWIFVSIWVVVQVSIFYGWITIIMGPGIAWLFIWQIINLFRNIQLVKTYE